MTDKNRQAASKRLGLKVDETGNVEFSKQSIMQSVGGWVGIAEAVLPGTAFAISYTLNQNMLQAIVIAAAISLGFIARQIVLRKPLTQAIAGIAGLALTAWLALRPGGNDADYFVPGLITNTVYASALILSVLIRWPLIGLLVGAIRGDLTSWRKDSAQLKRFSAVTLLWVVMFGTRLLVQVPLYLAGNLAALQIAKLILGLPWYALFIWLSWLSLKSAFSAKR